MTYFYRNIPFCLMLCAALVVQTATAQNSQSKIVVPTDPVLEYDPSHPPGVPDWEHQVVKWVRTFNIANGDVQNRSNNAGWNSDSYKAYAFGQGYSTGLAFRLLFPRTYSVQDDGKKYPLIIFLHGQGENDTKYLPPTPNYDNHWHLLQGPHEFDTANQNGSYDGFVLAPQLQNPASGFPTTFYFGIQNDIMKIVKFLIDSNKVDPFRIVVNGLSEGGVGSWDMLSNFPTSISAAMPMSAPTDFNHDSATINKIRYSSIWCTQGMLDKHPWPWETQRVADSMNKYGANFRESKYPDNQHDTWYSMWREWRFWPFVNNSYSSNPWPLYGRSKFWTGEPINTTVGINNGFEAYEWRRNGVPIPGATSNSIHVTSTGVYDARVMKDGLWSAWSYVPVNVVTGTMFRKQAEDWENMAYVRVEPTTDSAGGLDVGYIDYGDWMDYTLGDTVLPAPNVPGIYTLKLRVAAFYSGAQLQIKNQDSTVIATVDIPQTFGWQNWRTLSVDIPLAAGKQNIRIQSSSATNYNINWIELSTNVVQAPLPIKFVYFNAGCQSSAVNLQWRTSQEQNVQRYSVQRSVDGLKWEDIGTVPALGQGTQDRSYVFTDKLPASWNSFYRIVEYDLSGKQTLSGIVKSNCSSKEEVNLYPNPSSGNSSLHISLVSSANVTVQVLDSKGALMQQKQIQLPSGISTVPLDMNNYAKGVYTLKINYGSKMEVIKMIKK
jgi:predicted esterase